MIYFMYGDTDFIRLPLVDRDVDLAARGSIPLTDSIRIAVAGAGVIGQRHIDIAAHEGLLSAVVDPAPTGKHAAARLGVAWHRSLDDLLALDPPDGVVLATPNQMHVDNALTCVAAGVPTLVEKPLADTVAHGERLVAAAAEAGVPLLTGHHRRYNPLVGKARALIDAGVLGRIVAAHVNSWFYKPDDYFDVSWRRQAGAGPVLINLIHDIDLMRYLCGDIASVQAIASNDVRGHPVEDTAAVLLRFGNGALGTLTVSDTIVAPWSWEMTAAENPAYPVTGESCYRIGGTKGSLSLPDLAVWQNSGQRSWFQPIAREAQIRSAGDPLVLQLRHFADVIRGQAEPLVSGYDGLQALKAVDAVLRAARSGTVVELG